MKHYICTSFGISDKTYGSIKELLRGTGQGNSISGIIYRDISCVIFKYLEDINLGATITSLITKEIFQSSRL